MQGHTQRTLPRGLLLGVMLALGSPPASAGEGPRLELLTRDSYLAGIPLLLRVELRNPDGSLHRDRWNAVARLPGSKTEVCSAPTTEGGSKIAGGWAGDFSIRGLHI